MRRVRGNSEIPKNNVHFKQGEIYWLDEQSVQIIDDISYGAFYIHGECCGSVYLHFEKNDYTFTGTAPVTWFDNEYIIKYYYSESFQKDRKYCDMALYEGDWVPYTHIVQIGTYPILPSDAVEVAQSYNSYLFNVERGC